MARDKGVFFCGRLGRRVRVSFCGNACRECTRWRDYSEGRTPSAGIVNPQSVPCGGATSASGGEREASSFQTAFELFFGVKP